MNGIHDMGGMHGFGPVAPERDEPVFHAEWERRMFALALAVMGRRAFNIDEYRRTIERMPPHEYLAASYYERWRYALESLLIEKGLATAREIDVVMAAVQAGASPPAASERPHPPAAEASGLAATLVGNARDLRHDASYRPRFVAGDRVIARVMNPAGHTRIPRYIRGHHGIIHRDWGVFVFPDTHAHGEGANPEHCYAVEFDAREVWGSDSQVGDRLYVDLWESYLEAVAEDARPQTVRGTKNGAIRKTGGAVKSRAAKTARASIKSATQPSRS